MNDWFIYQSLIFCRIINTSLKTIYSFVFFYTIFNILADLFNWKSGEPVESIYTSSRLREKRKRKRIFFWILLTYERRSCYCNIYGREFFPAAKSQPEEKDTKTYINVNIGHPLYKTFEYYLIKKKYFP